MLHAPQSAKVLHALVEGRGQALLRRAFQGEYVFRLYQHNLASSGGPSSGRHASVPWSWPPPLFFTPEAHLTRADVAESI